MPRMDRPHIWTQALRAPRAVYLLLALIIGLLIPTLSKAAESIDLSDLRDWQIVVAPDAIESELHAAREFQAFYQQAAGIELPIVREIGRPDHNVFIGPGSDMRASDVGFDTGDMGDEALRIVVSNSNIAIAGGRPRGTLYGVYTFLEDYLGIRFLTPDHTHVPPVGETRPLPPVDRTYDPPIVFRWSYWHAPNEYKDFAARTRSNGAPKYRTDLGGVSKYQLINHSLHRYINTKDYGAEHPEYFALVDGQRRAHIDSPNRGADASGEGTQLCMSNPDVIRILTEKAIAELRDNPHQRLVQLGQADNEYYCRCDACAAIDEHEGTHMGALLTGINQIAEAVEREFPYAIIGTLAYKYSSKPPRYLHARHNVQIQLCSIECSVTKPMTDPTSARNVEFIGYVTAWRERATGISIWTYCTNFWEFLLPGPTLRVLGPNIKFYFDHGVTQFFVQGNTQSPGGAFADVTNYVVSRLLWDPTLDSDALIDEFLSLHYGSAAPPIRRFIDLMAENVDAKGIDRHCYGRAEDFGITPRMIRAGFEAYDEAMKLADDDAIRERLDLFKLWMCRAAMERAWVVVDSRGKPRQRGGEDTVDWMKRVGILPGGVDRQVQQHTRPYIREMFALIQKHNVTHWREGMPVTRADELLRYGFGMTKEEAW